MLPRSESAITKDGSHQNGQAWVDWNMKAGEGVVGGRGGDPDASLATILAEHTQKFNDILNAVQDIKCTLEPKNNALRIDIGHLRKYHKKLKDCVESTENTVSEMCPTVAALPLTSTTYKMRVKRGTAGQGNLGLEEEQVHVILGDGPLVTPQTAEDVL
ncbi:hypothetical protein NDU88_004900 [Pleurodeles waltl]|uniref:Uncharacterized protein n=1 Tax=Pleurodeles waltl TaxID=8319 RepID=A0AAV7VM15_PLEWA|nr:hypothetical protein NDU88_004900 [Pleurodeles waltl]